MLGGALCGVSTPFLYASAAQLPVPIRNIREFGYCVVGYLGLLSTAAFAIIGLSGVVVGILVLRRAVDSRPTE